MLSPADQPPALIDTDAIAAELAVLAEPDLTQDHRAFRVRNEQRQQREKRQGEEQKE